MLRTTDLPYSPGIYKIVNLENGKEYVGSSLDVNQRCRKHKSNLINKKKGQIRRLQKDFNKFGIESFEFVLLESCAPDALNKKEKKWLKKLSPRYNVSKNTTVLGTKRTEKQCNRMSLAIKKLLRENPEQMQQQIQKARHACREFYAFDPKGKRIGKFITQGDCSKKIGVSTANISNYLRGEVKSTKHGYTFKYV
jgi:hypothetical protein